MQALENIGVLEKDEERGGRRITQSGQRDLDREPFCLCDGSDCMPILTHTCATGIAQTTLEESDEEDEE